MRQVKPINGKEIKEQREESFENGDLIYYSELLDRAHKDGLRSIATRLIQIPSKENQFTVIVFARVRTHRGIFTGHGDASPTNVDPEIAPHIIRAAETRAKARALRDAVNCGVVAAEELSGGFPEGYKQKRAETVTDGDGYPPKTEAKPPTTPQAIKTDGKPVDPLMTEAQKRYLFRLMAMQGMEGDVAQDQLKKMFNVDYLKAATKAQASQMIEELVAQAKGGGA